MGLFWSQHLVRAGSALPNRLWPSPPAATGSGRTRSLRVGRARRQRIRRATREGRLSRPVFHAARRGPSSCGDRLGAAPKAAWAQALRMPGCSPQPQVDPRRVCILTASRGSEADLLAAAHWPALVHGVPAVAPSSVVWGANPGQCQSREPHRPRRHRGPLPIERFRGPVMLISGGDDQLWPSTILADRIMAALHADPARHVHLNYPQAGGRSRRRPAKSDTRGTRAGPCQTAHVARAPSDTVPDGRADCPIVRLSELAGPFGRAGAGDQAVARSRRLTSAHSSHTEVGTIPARISSANTWHPRQTAKIDSSPAATTNRARTTSAAA
jgi:bile acid acyltransferase/acyl-CoA thioester hydrolase-like protein